MNQEMRNRRAIDLDELERQLRLSAENSDARGVADPLAELARLVGNDDPFKDILGQQGDPLGKGGLPRQQGRASDEALRALEAEFAADLRPAYDAQDGDPFAQPQDQDGYQGYDHEPHSQEAHSYDPRPPVQGRTTVVPPRRSVLRSRGFVVVGGAMVLAFAGVFAVFGMRSEHEAGSGAIPIIAAKPGQDKVRPANPGGVDVPNQNKQVFEPEIERAAADTAKVVTTTEQPIDLAAAPLAATPRMVPAEGAAQLPVPTGPGPDGAAAPPPPAAGNEPKRVRSIAITVNDAGSETTATTSVAPIAAAAAPQSGITAALGQNGIAAVPSAPAAPAAAVPPPAAPSRAAVAPAVASPEDPAPSTVSTPTHASPATPAKTTPVKTTAKAAKQVPHAPLSLAPPPKGTRVATAHVEAPAARSSAGGWAVQLGWRSSPALAQQAAQSYSARYGNVLGGAAPHVVPGESGGKQIYRIRVSAGERSNATGLCEKIKTAGGSCFVARN